MDKLAPRCLVLSFSSVGFPLLKRFSPSRTFSFVITVANSAIIGSSEPFGFILIYLFYLGSLQLHLQCLSIINKLNAFTVMEG